MRGLLFLAPAALALQPMKPVSYDAFELAAAEALKDELRANYQKRAARERSMAAPSLARPRRRKEQRSLRRP